VWIEDTEVFSYYDFDYTSQVKNDDYVRIITKSDYNDFGCYDIYYVDMQKYIVYFIHANT
jgi:uncharacterized protein (DUF2344 family)